MTDSESAYGSCHGDHCVTCSDEGIAMSVVRVDHARGLALCEDDEVARHTIEVSLVGPVALGDRVLVHAGVAIAMLVDGEGTEAPAAARRVRARQGPVLAI
jgi:hydrogenase expression/formation protein HypC